MDNLETDIHNTMDNPETDTNNIKTQHNMCWIQLCANKHK